MDGGGDLKKDLRRLLRFIPGAPPSPGQNHCEQSCNFYVVIKVTELDDYAHKNYVSALKTNESILHDTGSLIFHRVSRGGKKRTLLFYWFTRGIFPRRWFI